MLLFLIPRAKIRIFCTSHKYLCKKACFRTRFSPSSVRSLAENEAAYAYNIAAFLYCYAVIVAHSPGAELHAFAQLGEFPATLLEEVVCRAEVPSYALLVVGVGGHAHDAGDDHPLEVAELSAPQVFHALLGGESELGLLFGNVELQQAANLSPSASISFTSSSIPVSANFSAHVLFFIAVESGNIKCNNPPTFVLGSRSATPIQDPSPNVVKPSGHLHTLRSAIPTLIISLILYLHGNPVFLFQTCIF